MGMVALATTVKTALFPHEAIKVKAFVPHPDWKQASMGAYKQKSKMDLCESCYNLLFGYVARQNKNMKI